MKKTMILVVMLIVAMVVLCGCTEADKVNRNISKQADYFDCERRITVYNARTDTARHMCSGCWIGHARS